MATISLLQPLPIPFDLPDYRDYQEACCKAFLEGVATDYYHQGIEDCMKALPPLHPYNEVYMQGYNLQVKPINQST